MDTFLKTSYYYDHHSVIISEFVETVCSGFDRLNEQILALYFGVRDQIIYSPTGSVGLASLQASQVLQAGKGHCIDKALLLGACYRNLGIPARIGLAKVKNHIATEKIQKLLGTDVLVPHGYVEVFHNDKWVKCTPAFNRSLCEIFEVAPLNFDGENDSLFQEHSKVGARFMEYVVDYGSFSDLPIDLMDELLIQNYGSDYREKLSFNEPKIRKEKIEDLHLRQKEKSLSLASQRDPVAVASNDLNQFVNSVFG